MVSTLPAPTSQTEVLKRRQLQINRRRATGLLALTTVVWLATLAGDADGWLGYVRAGAEASMVGGLADWFAVTALFRHPLGIPIPHTAIIPERKDQFGETLGSFVQESFLTPDAIVERVRAADVATRIAVWLAEPANADRAAAHAVDAALAAADLARDDDVHRVLEQVVRERIATTAVAPLAGRVLEQLTADGRHHDIVAAGLVGLSRFLHERHDDLRNRFAAEAPWWLPGAVEDRIFDRLLDGVGALLDRAAADPNHELRVQLDARLQRLAVDLQTDPGLRARGEQWKHELLEQPEIRAWTASLWTDVKTWLREQAGDPAGPLRRGLSAAIVTAGERLRDDPALLAQAQSTIESGAGYVAEHFHGEIANLVRATVARWDAKQTSDRLELLLGPDLQFIRINGTVVGGAAGLVLYTVSQLL
ncbi:MAG: hypothetical protein QOE63_258 [Acidimicrobiaceae bacterium]